MKNLLISALLLLPLSASAKPYFRVLNPLDEIKTGAFIHLGSTEDRISYGMQTTLIKHYASDGYLLIPGVSYSLLDVGFAKPDSSRGARVILGPSMDISEPVKELLRRGLDYMYPNRMLALRALLWPAVEGEPCVTISLGPGLAVDPGDFQDHKTVKGYAVLHAGLQAKF